jgi:hypothetical protein
MYWRCRLIKRQSRLRLYLKCDFSKELNRLLGRVQCRSRTVVRSALKEIRNLKNSIKADLDRSYQIDQMIRARREELVCRRMMDAGHTL